MAKPSSTAEPLSELIQPTSEDFAVPAPPVIQIANVDEVQVVGGGSRIRLFFNDSVYISSTHRD